jgi:hypothetical protein
MDPDPYIKSGDRMRKIESGSTAQLLLLCLGYFVFYVAYSMFLKYFTEIRDPRRAQFVYLFNNTLGSSVLCVAIVLVLGWIGLLAATSNRLVPIGPFKIPVEVAYIIPSGICTAVVIPTTTLMYSLGISVMVAQVIMRGIVIVISRAVDEVQIRQGILKKRVYREENWGVVFALLAVATVLLLFPVALYLKNHGFPVPSWLGVNLERDKQPFDFIHNPVAMTILILYTIAYAIRIYIMNLYRNTRPGGRLDNRGFFGVEQITASITMLALGWFFFAIPWDFPQVVAWQTAVRSPDASAILSGIPYGLVAFFSVFLFMFKGRTATFSGLANRLTSLFAGTVATLLMWAIFRSKFPTAQDWLSVAFILGAVYFLTRAEKKRVAELALAPASSAAQAPASSGRAG